MITLRKIKLNNFLSHADTEVSFKDNQKLLIDGVSGSGKSSIVEGLIWALYGRGRVDNRNVIKRGKKFVTVVVELSDDKYQYRIERSYDSSGKHTLNVGEKVGRAYVPLKKIGLTDTQEWIEKYLIKSSYTLFINSVAYPQDNIENFVKQTAIKRKELLLEIANTEGFDAYYDNAKEKISVDEKTVFKIDLGLNNIVEKIKSEKEKISELPYLENSVSNYSAFIDSLTKKIEENKEKQNYIVELKNQIDKEATKISGFASRLKEQDELKTKKEDKLKQLNNINQEEIEDGLMLLNSYEYQLKPLLEALKLDYEADLKRQAIMLSKPRKNDYSANLRVLEGQLLDIHMANDSYCEHLGRNCPKLEQEIKNKTTFIENQINDIKERVDKNIQEEKDYQDALSVIPLPQLSDEQKKQVEFLKSECARLEKYKISAAIVDDRVKDIKEIKNELEDLSLSIISTEEELKVSVSAHKDLIAELNSLNIEDVKELERKLEDNKIVYYGLVQKVNAIKESEALVNSLLLEEKTTKDLLKTLNYDLGCLELIKEAFGSKGIKTIIVDYLIPRLEYRINEILSKMSDFRIRLETQRSKASGDGTIEGLFINIYNEQGECFDFANYSGGQRLKIIVAISEALATLQKCGFRIFDEVFVGLDESSIEGFNEVMHSLQDKFSQILCISHLRTIKDSFEDKLTVVKEGDTSKIYD